MKFDAAAAMEQLKRLDIKARYVIFAAVLGIILLADYFLIIEFQLKGLTWAKTEIKTTAEEIERVKGDLQRVHQIQNNLQNSRTQLKALNLKIRSFQEVPVILEEIAKTANEFNVRIDQLTPQKEAQEILISSPEGKYYALPIVIRGRSGYHMFGRFLNSLEAGNLFFIVHNLRMEANEKDPNNLGFQTTLKLILVDTAAGK